MQGKSEHGMQNRVCDSLLSEIGENLVCSSVSNNIKTSPSCANLVCGLLTSKVFWKFVASSINV